MSNQSVVTTLVVAVKVRDAFTATTKVVTTFKAAMTPERWQHIERLYYAARELPPDERGSWLTAACRDDADMRSEVEVLLDADQDASGFLTAPALQLAARGLAADEVLTQRLETIVGQQFSHYKILSRIGAGGMGEVYLARDTSLERRVALKLLPVRFTQDAERLQRFIREAKAASALNHPNIITIYEVGVAGVEPSPTHFIATEFIEGVTLRDWVPEEGKRVSQTLEFGSQIASALSAAHQAGIVHRDIKPENLMVRPDGLVKVLDFGLAKLTANYDSGDQPIDTHEPKTPAEKQTMPGMIMGTPRYMSPEQARGLELDARTDLFSLGVVLYELLAGCPPFSGESMADLFVAILEKEPVSLAHYVADVPAELERILRRCLMKQRGQRYQSAQELLADLKNFAAGRTSQSHGVVTVSPTIAVLPFVNMSADAENEYFCDGLAEELLNALAKIEHLGVAARTSSFFFKGKEADVREIGRKLNVSTVLEGSVRKSGNRLRITAQLINVSDGYHLWSERYDREMKDIFEVQDEISLMIVDKLKLKLLGAEKAAVLRRYTDNTEAYQLYLKGRFHWNKRTGAALKASIVFFEQAIEKDPDYALAYAGLADAWVLLPRYYAGLAQECYPKAKAAALKALALDETLAEAHATLALTLFDYEWNLAESNREFQRALALSPNYATAHHWYGNSNLTTMERFDEAIAALQRAQELEPLSLSINVDLGNAFFNARRYDQAIEQLKNTLEIEPNFYPAHIILGLARMMKGELAEARAAFERAEQLNPADLFRLALRGHLQAVSGERAEALQTLDRLQSLSPPGAPLSACFALIYAGLDDKDQAFHWLERGYEDRILDMTRLKVTPLLDHLHADPRFADLVRRVGL